MSLLKVIRGTRSLEGEFLCTSCHSSHIMRGPADGEEVVMCDYSKAQRVPFKVVECNNYSNKNLPTLDDMRRTAWVLSTDEKKKAIGFISAKEWRKSNKRDIDIPGEYD